MDVSVLGSRGTWWLTAVAVAASLAAGCVQPVGPARTADDYERKAKDTAETVLSAVRTAELAVDVAVRDRAFPSYVAVVLGDAEGEAAGAASTFAKVQPPGASSDRLRGELGDLLDEADDVLSATRIAGRRSDDEALGAQAEALGRLADRLDAFVTEHE
jgi:hypothetical protein